MAASAVSLLRSRSAPLARATAARRSRVATVIGLGVLVALSVLLRTQRLDVGFWIDEALSVGIADRPLADIPGTLRLDGSPPLYYLILHAWMQIAGTGEAATHALSLVFAVATIPVAWALARSLFGDGAGWIAALLAAGVPFLTQYAQETRMYSLVVLLGTVATATFLGAFALRRGRGWTLGFAGSLAAMLYTHNWALFFAAACGAAWLWLAWAERDRGLLREGLVGFGLAGLAFAPWVPTLIFQAAHTGAPWANAPGVDDLLVVPLRLLKDAPAAVIAVAGIPGLVALARAGDPRQARAVIALAAIFTGTVLLAWAASQASPAWATRYLAAALPPLLLLAAAGLSRAGVPGLLALVVSLGVWIGHPGPEAKSNVREVAAAIEPSLRPGDLVISTQPEQLPALAYYLETPGLRWATLTGAVEDTGVTDWRDGVERLAATSPRRDLRPLLATMAPGSRVVLLSPQFGDLARWSAPWTRLVRLRSADWHSALRKDPRFRAVAVRPMTEDTAQPNPVQATIFARRAMR